MKSGEQSSSTSKQFIGAALRPVAGTIEPTRMDAGGPGLPRQFRWGTRTVEVVSVLKTWRDTGPCHHGSGERYARKHWFEIETDGGERMKIYFERQARSKGGKDRWRLFTIEPVRPS